jgi:hypothetical protein
VLAGNAVSRATAYTALDDNFRLDPNTRRLFEDTGFLLFASATLAAILLVIAVSLARFATESFPAGSAGPDSPRPRC